MQAIMWHLGMLVALDSGGTGKRRWADRTLLHVWRLRVWPLVWRRLRLLTVGCCVCNRHRAEWMAGWLQGCCRASGCCSQGPSDNNAA
jgi:hypothetical protein